MSVPGKQSIVVGVDGSDRAQQAVRWAAKAALRHNAPLDVVAVINTAAFGVGESVAVTPGLLADLDAQAHRCIADAAGIINEISPDIRLREHIPLGAPVPTLLEFAEEARMIVVGTRGLGAFTSAMIGSTAAGLTAHSPCPVAVIREETERDRSVDAPVVVGVDSSKASESAIAAAFDEAALLGAPLVAVHTWTDITLHNVNTAHWWEAWQDAEPRERMTLAEMLAGWREYYPDVDVRRVVAADRPVRYLVEHAADAQLLVVGSRGRGGFSGMLLGSTSQALLHCAPCPLLVARSRKDE